MAGASCVEKSKIDQHVEVVFGRSGQRHLDIDACTQASKFNFDTKGPQARLSAQRNQFDWSIGLFRHAFLPFLLSLSSSSSSFFLRYHTLTKLEYPIVRPISAVTAWLAVEPGETWRCSAHPIC